MMNIHERYELHLTLCALFGDDPIPKGEFFRMWADDEAQ